MTCYPLTLELVVETQYPAPEATASGLVFFVGQIVGAVTMPVANLLATSASAADLEINTCGRGGRNGESGDGDLSSTIEPRDFTWTNVFLCALASISCCALILFFRADYVRTRVEKKSQAHAEGVGMGQSAVAFDNADDGAVKFVSIKRIHEDNERGEKTDGLQRGVKRSEGQSYANGGFR